MSNNLFDAIVIGGGFYGCAVADYLGRQRGLQRVVLIESTEALFSYASYHNQARVHNGYHYPRSFTTGFRSHVNFSRFVRDYQDSIISNCTMLYAVASKNSKITAKQFQRFCHEIGAPLTPAPQSLKKLFSESLIEDVFQVEEAVFDANKLREQLIHQLNNQQTTVILNTQVKKIDHPESKKILHVECEDQTKNLINFAAPLVFNCTYSGLNQLEGVSTQTLLKHEITEIALMQAPPELQKVGITIVDGPFFSLMPFPPEGLHTLSHVRYTPHFSWKDQPGVSPYLKLQNYTQATHVDRMVRDAARYFPSIKECQYVKSLFTVKTTLLQTENTDARPILFEKPANLPGYHAILGGKIDNIYDILEKLDAEPF